MCATLGHSREIENRECKTYARGFPSTRDFMEGEEEDDKEDDNVKEGRVGGGGVCRPFRVAVACSRSLESIC